MTTKTRPRPTIRVPASLLAPARLAAGPPYPARWKGVITAEGRETGDGRLFAEGGLSWRDLPLPVMVQLVTADGHDGAELGGQMDRIERDGELIRAWGSWDLESAAGQEAARLNAEGRLTGASVDVDMIEIDGGPAELVGEIEVLIFDAARIMGFTMTPFPAFAEAQIEPDYDWAPEGFVAKGATFQADVGGAMIAALPADPEALAVEGGDATEDLHATIAFLASSEDLPGIPPEALDIATQAAAEVAALFGPFEATVSGYGVLGSEDPPATVLFLQSEDVEDLHEAIWERLEVGGFEENYPSFICHLTLGYGVDLALAAPFHGTTIAFDRLLVSIGDVDVEYPLGEAMPEEPPAEPAPEPAPAPVPVEAAAVKKRRRSRGEDGRYETPPAEEAAAVLASAFPVKPPAAWFKPNLAGPTPLTVTDDGRVFGHIATWNTCHIGLKGDCEKPRPSRAEYAYFLTGELKSKEGEAFRVGQITLGGGHAPLRGRDGGPLSPRLAAQHYDDTGTAAADVTAGDDKWGIWVAGAARPELTDSQIRALRAAAPSGDWRRIGGALELVAALAVNVPGFPVPRPRQLVAGGEPVALVASLGPAQPSGDGLTAGSVRLLAAELARSIGRDTKSRAAELAASLGR